MNLPSQRKPSAVDEAFERGYIFGRDAVIKRVREQLETTTPLPAIRDILNELERTDFRL